MIVLTAWKNCGLDHIHEFDGDVSETSGDGMMVLFLGDDPQEHALQAARAALAVLQATEDLNATSDLPPLALHIGINSGMASVGSTRYEGKNRSRWVFTADGLMANVAARVSNIARAGEVFVTPETAQRIEGHFRLRDAGQHTVKNVAEPVQVYSVEGKAF